MDYGDYYWGLYRNYYRDPFAHSLLRTRQSCFAVEELQPLLAESVRLFSCSSQ